MGTTDGDQDDLIKTLKNEIVTQTSQIHRNGLVNRRLDNKYYYIYHGDEKGTSEEYVWTLEMAPKNDERLSAGGSITLGIITFWLIPYGIAMWLPFYFRLVETGKSDQVVQLTVALWITTLQVWYKHAKVIWKKFRQSKIGQKLEGMCCKKKKIQPEDIDPATGLPYG